MSDRRLRVDVDDAADLDAVIGAIDRSEHVDVEYAVIDRRIVARPATMTEVPRWVTDGDGPHSVSAMVAFARDVLSRGGVFLVARLDRTVAGVAIVVPQFEPPLSWLAVMHVSRLHRRSGVASVLHDRATALAVAVGATSMYVSATPTGSAVGFYLSRGFRLAVPPHPELLELEPDDVHLVLDLTARHQPQGAQP